MSVVTLIGIDLGKHSVHLHAQDAAGRMVFRKKLTRSQLSIQPANVPSCTVVMETCAAAHWVARELAASGHTARLISPQFVKPFVQGNKNAFNDAQAICEAASRPSIRFVHPKMRSPTDALGAASGARRVGSATHGRDQPDPRQPAGVRHQPAKRLGGHQAAAGCAGSAS